MHAPSARAGFSLVELMIVVAIMGILAAIAIPNFFDLQNRARRAELPANVNAIKIAQFSYDAAHDGFVTATIQPRSLAMDGTDRQMVSWPLPNPADWTLLGWRPDGQVRGVYRTFAVGEVEFCVEGDEDVAGDGQWHAYYSTSDTNVTIDNPPAGCTP